MNRYNRITAENSVKPNYEVSDKDLSIDIYVSPQEEVCIVGKLDNNYIRWCSITSGSEIETNAEIINNILSNSGEGMYSTDYRALGNRYREIKKWHFFSFAKTWYKDHYRYRSPVSQCFVGDPPYNNGLFLAKEIRKFFRVELNKCQYRIVDAQYETILNRYKALLLKETSPEHYHQMQPIMAILNNENYLKLCPDPEIRELYLECLDQCSNLYNCYMTAVR